MVAYNFFKMATSENNVPPDTNLIKQLPDRHDICGKLGITTCGFCIFVLIGIIIFPLFGVFFFPIMANKMECGFRYADSIYVENYSGFVLNTTKIIRYDTNGPYYVCSNNIITVVNMCNITMYIGTNETDCKIRLFPIGSTIDVFTNSKIKQCFLNNISRDCHLSNIFYEIGIACIVIVSIVVGGGLCILFFLLAFGAGDINDYYSSVCSQTG